VIEVLPNAELLSGMEYDAPTVSVDLNAIVDYAFDTSGADGMLVLEAQNPVLQSPYELISLLGALIYLLAPEEPKALKVYTFDALDHGCVEIRNSRPMTALPEGFVEHANSIGVGLQLVRRGEACSVLLSIPSDGQLMKRAS